MPSSDDPSLPLDGQAATPPEQLFTRVVDEVFRLNGTLLVEGDAIAAAAGITAAQWRVLGRLVQAPTTVAEIARQRGLRRQSVQESVVRLERAGLVERTRNEADRRAPLVLLTERGRAALRAIEPHRAAWATSRSAEFDIAELHAAVDLLHRLRSGAATAPERAPTLR